MVKYYHQNDFNFLECGYKACLSMALLWNQQ